MSKSTHIGFLGDESGSMAGNQQAMVEGFNDFVGNVRKDTAGKDVQMTLGFFDLRGDDSILRIKMDGPLKDCRELSLDDYKPHGSTPLNDATVQMIHRMEKNGANRKLLVIFTDGHENASEMSTKKVRKLIAKKEKQGWEFIYLGANQDAWDEGAQRGIASKRSYNFTSSEAGTRSSFAVASELASMRTNLDSPMFSRAADALHDENSGTIEEKKQPAKKKKLVH
jgi:hypothetical protein